MVEIYRAPAGGGRQLDVVPVVALQSPSLPPGHLRASSDRLAAKIAAGSTRHAGARAARRRRRAGPRRRRWCATPPARPVGVVIASDFLSGDLARHARRIAEAYEDYSQLRVLKRPLEGVYLSLFLMMTLMILVSATWLGLYLAKRITRPVGMLAAGAREIGAGHLDHRIEPETRDEFGSLVEAFNSMAGELATSQRRAGAIARRDGAQELRARRAAALHRDGPRAHRDRRHLDRRRRPRRARSTPRRRACSTSIAAIVGAPVDAGARARGSAAARRAACARCGAASRKPAAQEIALAREGREIHLAAAATALHGEAGAHEGTVLVFDDVTPLVRTQRVAAWRDVARRLAHEIKNPLTPIQLSRRAHAAGTSAARRKPRARWSTSARRRSSARSNR